MKRKILLLLSILFLAACAPQSGAEPTATLDISDAATQTAAAVITATPLVPVTPTTTVAPLPVPPEIATQTAAAAQTPQGGMQFLAYIQNGHLVVTDVTNGVKGGTTQYTVAGQSDQVTDLVWSPSGEFVAFVSAATGTPHVFYIYALGQT
jgi:hypothetical protein